MYVCAFVGPSGTGKSHRAHWVAREHDIKYIIDDGLLIDDNSVLAGRSAKREKTKIGAVKTAVLTDEAHAIEIKSALKEYNVDRLMILGTSDAMVAKIAARLGINEINETVYIQDISTQYEIQQALNSRRMEGKHVIPVPTLELKRDFSGLMLDPLNILRKRGTALYDESDEKSVIRPTYSYMGRYTISDYTIYQFAERVTMKHEAVNKIIRFRTENGENGIHIEMDLILYYGFRIPTVLTELRRTIAHEIETYTSLNTSTITLTVQSVVPKKL